jgi:uncharacterized protein (TIGR03382 family)
VDECSPLIGGIGGALFLTILVALLMRRRVKNLEMKLRELSR